ncbi:YybS family protein [Alkaliphilus pronyensis]|uniref:YybS family protein n=1 Tax=Alkaliphilus pronyensis TaxID=1482732 RepID=A0A6I0F7J0_9FIRM|nr:YybS family protein [Alkaliphilus pronyensis]KAB3530308.1 YybS family protein [Alkaliphilus pronyensis]
MELNNNKKAMIEAAFIATISSFFGISVIYIPVLTILLFLLPVPLIVLAVRQGTKYTVLALIITSLIIGILTEVVFTFFLIIIFGPVALIMGYYIKKKQEPFKTIGIGTTVSALTTFISILTISAIVEFNFADLIGETFRSVVEHQSEMFTSMNVSITSLNEIIDYLTIILPGLLIVHSMVITFINYYVSIAILRRLRFQAYKLPRFRHFKLPSNIILGSFILFILTYLTRFVAGINYEGLYENIKILFLFVFYLQGIAFMRYMISKVSIPEFARVLIIVLLIIISPLLTLISLIGLIDSVFDIRKLREE